MSNVNGQSGHSVIPGLSGLVLVLGLGAPAQAASENASASADKDAEILVIAKPRLRLTEPTVMASRLNLTPLETPASVATLEGVEIRARGDQNLNDAVARAPGFSNVANPGNGNTSFAVRGFDGAGSVLQLVDGIRLFPVAGTITFPTDPWPVERVDVLSGPASVLYGQGALGGAVNIVMRKPNLNRYEFEGRAGYGSQSSREFAAGGGGPLGRMVAFRLDASYRASDGYVDRGQAESLALSGALTLAPSDELSLTLRHDYGEQKPPKYFGTPLIDGRLDTAIRERNYNVADAQMHFRDGRTTLSFDWSPNDIVTVSNTAYYLTSKRKWRNLESYCWVGASGDCPNGYNGGGGTPGLIYRTDNLGIVHDQAQLGNQGSIKIATPLGGGVKNVFLVGFDYNYVKLTYSHDFGSDLQEDEVDPHNFDPGLFLDTQGIAPRYKTRTTEYAIFAEDQLRLSEQLSFVAGFRYEHDSVGRWNFVYDPSGTTIVGESPALNGGTTAYKDLQNSTWRVGAVYQPLSTLSLYAQYSTGVDPLGTLTTYSTSGSQFAFTNATGEQVEVGAKVSFLRGRGTATLAAYQIVKHDLVAQRNPLSPVEQIGQRSAEGLEASLTLDLLAGFGIDANATVLDANYDDFISGGTNYTGNTPRGVPQETANLWLRWEPTPRAQIRAGVRYVGSRFSDDANSFKVPSYVVVDGAFSYALTKNLAIDLRLSNIFDEDYAITTYNDEQWLLGRPRSVDVSLRAKF